MTDALGRVFGLFDALALHRRPRRGARDREHAHDGRRRASPRDRRPPGDRDDPGPGVADGRRGGGRPRARRVGPRGDRRPRRGTRPARPVRLRTGRRPGCRGRRSRSPRSLGSPVRPSPPGTRRASHPGSRSSGRSSSSRQSRHDPSARNRPGSSARLRPRDSASRAGRERGMTITVPRLDRLPVHERGITIADFLVPIRVSEGIGVRVRHLALILAGTLLIALAAQVRFYLPGNPVPVTGQTFGVLLAGRCARVPPRRRLDVALPAHRPRRACRCSPAGVAASTIVRGVTGGYIVGFILAAAIVGRLAELGWDRNLARLHRRHAPGQRRDLRDRRPVARRRRRAAGRLGDRERPDALPRRRCPEARPRRAAFPAAWWLVGRAAGRPLSRRRSVERRKARPERRQEVDRARRRGARRGAAAFRPARTGWTRCSRPSPSRSAPFPSPRGGRRGRCRPGCRRSRSSRRPSSDRWTGRAARDRSGWRGAARGRVRARRSAAASSANGSACWSLPTSP